MPSERILCDTAGSPADYLVTSRIRRCNGCSDCITDMRGGCSQPDTFSEEIPRILSSETLILITGADSGMVRMPMRKAVERLSNVLLAWTDAGSNVPLGKDMVAIRRIVIRYAGDRDDAFERYMREMLFKGPIEEIAFEAEKE